jgi:hypothetical protein
MFLKSWEKVNGKKVYYIQLYDNKIIIGSHYGIGMSDKAGTTSIKKFIKGEYQNLIIADFGKEVLQEVIYTLKNKL